MTDKVRLGIIGLGQMGSLYLDLLSRMEGVVVEAAADIDEERLRYAGSRGVKRLYRDYREMIDEGGFEGVLVVTPPKYHVEQALYAYRAGLYVHLDKPVAADVEDARRLYREAGDTDRIMVAFSLRYHGFYREIKRYLDENLGDPLYIWHIALGRLPKSSWLADRSVSGGMLNENGVHIVYLHYWYAGKPVEVYASTATLTQGITIEDNVYLRIKHPKAVSVFIQSWSGGHRRRGWGLVAEKGRVTVDGYLGGRYTVSLSSGEILSSGDIAVDVMDMYREQLRHFIDCIRDRRRPLTPLRDGVIVQEIVHAAYLSAEKGSPVKVEASLL